MSTPKKPYPMSIMAVKFMLGVTSHTLHRWEAEGRLVPAYRGTRNQRMYHAHDVIAFAEKNPRYRHRVQSPQASRLFSSREAAKILCVSWRVLRAAIDKGIVVPQAKTKRQISFEVRELRRASRENPGLFPLSRIEFSKPEYSINLAAKYLNITRHKFMSYFRRRMIVPRRMSGQRPYFDEESLDALARRRSLDMPSAGTFARRDEATAQALHVLRRNQENRLAQSEFEKTREHEELLQSGDPCPFCRGLGVIPSIKREELRQEKSAPKPECEHTPRTADATGPYEGEIPSECMACGIMLPPPLLHCYDCAVKLANFVEDNSNWEATCPTCFFLKDFCRCSPQDKADYEAWLKRAAERDFKLDESDYWRGIGPGIYRMTSEEYAAHKANSANQPVIIREEF